MRGKISIVGTGCTKFGENHHLSYGDMIKEAVFKALKETNLELKDIDGAWLGTAFPDAGVWKGRSGMDLAEPIGLFDIPITRVSNYCATGQDALRNACHALLSGEHKVVLVVGVEKLRDRTPQESLVKMMVETGHPFLQKGFTAAGTFAVYATRQMEVNNLEAKHLSMISVKNHKNGVHNPVAHYRKEITMEFAQNSPMVAYPLNLMDSCPTTDGAAAVILTRTEDALGINADFVKVMGQGLSVSNGWDLPFFDDKYEFMNFRASQKAAQMAYEQANIKNPFEEIDVAEVHDCFSIVEFLAYEDLGFCKIGEGKRFLEEGHPYMEGKLPVNVSGGLLSCGHPVGATALRMIHEITLQLQGKNGKRQLKNAYTGLAHNIGGPGAVSAVTILRRRD